MPVGEELSKRLAKVPYVLVAMLEGAAFTVAGYFFVFFAKAMYTLPQSLEIPWLLVFVVAFFFLLVRKRIRTARSDLKPKLE